MVQAIERCGEIGDELRTVGTQTGTEPLSLMVFVNEPRWFRGQYERYLAQVLRESFDCPEVPIRIVFRRREKIVLGGA